jgi:hypothetical protein
MPFFLAAGLVVLGEFERLKTSQLWVVTAKISIKMVGNLMVAIIDWEKGCSVIVC